MRTLSVTLIAAAALAVAPAAARADTIALGVAPDPVEDAGFLVTATGEGSEGANLYALIEPARSTGCAATYPAFRIVDDVVDDESAEGAYSLTGTAQVDDPGRYQLCAWLQQSSDSPVATARTRQLIDVRSARASVRIRGPRSVRHGRRGRFTVAGSSELPRWLEVDIKRAGGAPCDRAPTFGSTAILLTRIPAGDFGLPARVPHRLIGHPGRYRLCAWVIEGVLDQQPEAAVSYTFRVAGRH